MSDNRLVAEARDRFGKGAARRIRREHKIPAVMYGHGSKPVHITLPGHDTMLVLKNPNALLTIVIDGDEQLALAKDIQRNPIRPEIEHVDLVVVRRGEKVVVEVPVHLEGDAAPETIVNLDAAVLQVEAEATNLPDRIVVSVQDLTVGTQILAGQITLPDGSTLVSPEETLVVNITQMISQEALEAQLAAAEEAAGIEQEVTDAELEEVAAADGAQAAEGEAEGAAAPSVAGDEV